jgi:hypothetical protein
MGKFAGMTAASAYRTRMPLRNYGTTDYAVRTDFSSPVHFRDLLPSYETSFPSIASLAALRLPYAGITDRST